MARTLTTQRMWVAWSSGKDSALALARLRDDPRTDVVGLLTTVDHDTERVPLHSVRRELVRAQAAALGIPLTVVALQRDSEEAQARALGEAVETAKLAGVDAVAFGDIHLEWARERRERSMAGTGVDAVFPLWGVPSSDLAEEVVDRSIEAVVTCVDTRVLPEALLGHRYDRPFLASLPESADPCGENGEFHTFVTDHPAFASLIDVLTESVRSDPRYPSIELSLG